MSTENRQQGRRSRFTSWIQQTYQVWVSLFGAVMGLLAPSLWPLRFEQDAGLIIRQVLFVVLGVLAGLLLWYVPRQIRSEISTLEGHLEALREQHETEKAALERRLQDDAKVLVKRLSMPLNYQAEAASGAGNTAERREAMRSVRTYLLTEVQRWLSKGDRQVRVNLFVTDEDNTTLAVPTGCSTGGAQSERTFRPGDETYENAVGGQARIEPDCTDLDDFADTADHRGRPRYKSFSAFPVVVPGRLFAILAADAEETDFFTEFDDELMKFYAHMLAITFLHQGWQQWVTTQCGPARKAK